MTRNAGPSRVYWPGCAVCQFMKKDADFRYRCMQSTYFNPNGHESLMEVVRQFGRPFKSSAMYQHMRRHQAKDLIKAATKFDENGHVASNTLNALEAPSNADTPYEIGLDDFIQEGRNKLARNEMNVTATTYLQAIKIKSDIEKSTKDRRLDAVKAFFGPASKPTEGN